MVDIVFSRGKRRRKTRGRVQVHADRKYITFRIDHQTFSMMVEHDPELTPLKRNRWYAKMLRIALKRLQDPTFKPRP